MPDEADKIADFNSLTPEEQAALAKVYDPEHEGGGADFDEVPKKP